jgi:hypothetical protein
MHLVALLNYSIFARLSYLAVVGLTVKALALARGGCHLFP